VRFYRGQHRYYCGIDLHARTMYLCLLDGDGKVLLHRRIPCRPEAFLEAVEPYREDLVVCVECIFCWYWLADLCIENGI
jgi:predicted NBD/HSP70 family sugar kinase